MTKFVIDAYAWIEYLDGSERGRKAGDIIENSAHEIFTSAATLAEVVSKFLRGGKNVNIALAAINSLSAVSTVSQEIGLKTGEIHFEAKAKNKGFGMLDAFVVATARVLGAKILTGDEDFRQFKEAVFI